MMWKVAAAKDDHQFGQPHIAGKWLKLADLEDAVGDFDIFFGFLLHLLHFALFLHYCHLMMAAYWPKMMDVRWWQPS